VLIRPIFFSALRKAESLNSDGAKQDLELLLKHSGSKERSVIDLMAACINATFAFFEGDIRACSDQLAAYVNTLKFPEIDADVIASFWCINAICCAALNNTKKSIEYFESAIYFARLGDNFEVEIRAKSNLARLLRYTGDFESSLRLLEDLLAHGTSLSDTGDSGDLLNYLEYRVRNGQAMTYKCMAEHEIEIPTLSNDSNLKELVAKGLECAKKAIRAATLAKDNNKIAFALDTQMQLLLLVGEKTELVCILEQMNELISKHDKRGQWMISIAKVRLANAMGLANEAYEMIQKLEQAPHSFHPDLLREFYKAKVVAFKEAGCWEKAFHALNNSTAFELKQRSEQIEQKRIFMMLQIEKDIREATQFLSHDLRMPLQNIRARSINLDDDSTLYASRLEFIHHEANRSIELVETFLSFLESKSLTGHRFEAVDMYSLVDDACFDMEAIAQIRGITINREFSGPTIVSGVRGLLHRALSNLLANAINYTSPNHPIFVELMPEGSFVAIRIKDNGPGFGTRESEHESVSISNIRSQPGRLRQGLGLSIVDSVIHYHCGTWTARSHEKGGAVVELLLPIKY
jgi:signal transduction histidine kinase